MKSTKTTIQFNLYSIFFLSILIPFLAASVLFSMYYNYIITKQNRQNINNVLRSMSQNVENQLAELNKIASTGYMHTNILNAMESFSSPHLYSYIDDLKLSRLENDYTTAMIKLMFTSQHSISNISFFPVTEDSQSFYSLSKNSAGIKKLTFHNYQEQPWYQEAITKQGDTLYYPGHISYYLGNTKNTPVFSAVKLIINFDSKKKIGIIKIDSELSNLEKLLEPIQLEKASHLLILDQNLETLVSSLDTPINLSLQTLNGTHTINGSRYHVISKSIPGSDWTLAYLSSAHTELPRLFVSFIIAAFCMLLGTIAAFAVYKYRSAFIIKALKNIIQTIETIENGDLTARSHVASHNELRIISDALNNMSFHLNKHIEKEYIAVINQQKAEYKALQSQINPHFLYNTLNGFIALNRMGEKKRLEQGILQLTHLLRYTCYPQETTTIQKELEFLKEYLMLQKLKYDERLEFSICCDENVENLQIPKLLLQPIVENSIIHGLEPTDKTIQINISANYVRVKGLEPMVLIYMTDNGVGFEAGTDEAFSIGTKNVRTRVSLFQKDSLYTTSSQPGKGTKTAIIFTI